MKGTKSTYIVTKPFKTPQVLQTPISHSPAQIQWKKFNKGQILSGELKYANGKPAFVLLGKMTIIPLGNIKKLVTTDVVNSNMSGIGPASKTTKEYLAKTAPKIKYMDALILGALVGGVGFYAAEKKGIIKTDNPKYKLYAAAGGAALAWYIIYRHQNNKPKTKVI